jgi:hypothetical protein
MGKNGQMARFEPMIFIASRDGDKLESFVSISGIQRFSASLMLVEHAFPTQ